MMSAERVSILVIVDLARRPYAFAKEDILNIMFQSLLSWILLVD